MKKLIALIIMVTLLTACAPQPASTPVPPSTPVSAPISTATTHPTATLEPTPTPLPGTVVIPISEMADGIPWLEMVSNSLPTSRFAYFNTVEAPFDEVLVRKAFAAATDRDVIVAVAEKYGMRDPAPATTIVNPDVLGRDLYDEVGIPYDPELAREYFNEAGYSDGSSFPELSFLVTVYPDGRIPAFNEKVADALVAMWQETLGIKMTVVSLSANSYRELQASNPPGVFLLGWAADVNDPDNYLRNMFRTNAVANFGRFSNAHFDSLIDTASSVPIPSRRQELYIQAERLLCEEEVVVIPLYHSQ
jgi:oligopeptide transport system substrate-binding protein